jgi:two-component system, OmpR family, phosphate regulon sensor histidine kinase PhoR
MATPHNSTVTMVSRRCAQALPVPLSEESNGGGSMPPSGTGDIWVLASDISASIWSGRAPLLLEAGQSKAEDRVLREEEAPDSLDSSRLRSICLSTGLPPALRTNGLALWFVESALPAVEWRSEQVKPIRVRHRHGMDQITKPRQPGGETGSSSSSPATRQLPEPGPKLPPSGLGTIVATLQRWLDQVRTRAVKTLQQARQSWLWREIVRRFAYFRAEPYSGPTTLVVGTVLITLLLVFLHRIIPQWPSPGVVYLPLIAMLAYYWSWGLGIVATALQLLCVYVLFLPPELTLRPRAPQDIAELLVLLAVSGYILALVQLAKRSRDAALREAARFAALNAVGIALAREHDRDHLLALIARTACELTGAGFAAFTLRPLDPAGQPLVPPHGSRFHLAAVVGVTPEQEALFRRLPLGGEGILAPIFQHGAPVRVADAAEMGAVDVPRGHPLVRSFLGAPLLARDKQVLGGLLLGHSLPGRFTESDENVLQALAAQAAVALENTRLYQAAQDQARELTTVFESIADAVVVYDPEGNLKHENLAAAKVRRLLALHQRDSAPGSQAVTPPVVGSWPSNLPVSLVDDLGERHDFLVSASSLRAEGAVADQATEDNDGSQSSASPTEETPETSGTVVVWHEVTEARKLLIEQQARTEAEAQLTILQLLIDELPSGVCLIAGTDVRLVLANRSAQEVLGREWLVGQPLEAYIAESGVAFTGTNGQALPTEELASVQALRLGTAVRHSLEVLRRPDGTTLPILINAVALDPLLVRNLPLGDGRIGASSGPVAVVVFQDVTALKEAEHLKDEFIAVAAHELKTPMASVKGYADMLLHRSVGEADLKLAGWQIEALETIDQATNRLVELTDDLLDVARLQSDHLQLHSEPHDLIALTRRVMKRFQIVSGQHSLLLSTKEEFVVACIDVRRTEQIIGNLLSNAIKYSPQGGSVRISIQMDDEAGMASLSIADQGIGIPEDQQALLFNRFARAENARELGITGTGLGLYLCRELVERQGGRIWFTSKAGEGSTFSLSLPLAAPE